MARKGIMKDLPTNLPNLEYTCHIFILTKVDKILRGKTIDFPKFDPGFMFQINFAFFNVENIRGFTSTFVAIYYATSQPFEF